MSAVPAPPSAPPTSSGSSFLHRRLGITFQQRLGAGFSLGLRARNLVDHDLRLTQAHLAIEAHRRGRSFSLGLQKRW